MRCSELLGDQSQQVYWRSLFGAELTFPLEFAFALQNAFASDESNSTWSATIFEGENQDHPRLRKSVRGKIVRRNEPPF